MNKKVWHIIVTTNSSDDAKSFRFSKTFAISVLVFAIILLLFGSISTYLFFSTQIDLNRLKNLQTHNSKLKMEMGRVNSLLDTMKIELENLQRKDKEVRELQSMNSIDDDIRELGVGGTQFTDSTFSYDKTLFALHNEVLRKSDFLKRQLDFENSSFEEISKYLITKNTIFQHTPSIKPVSGRISDTYGYRIHPIKKIRHFHHGIDIANRVGVPVRATADGKIERRGYHKDYGKYVLVDHGYGYKTYYAHLNKIYVPKGDSVTKYQIIGEVGKTGCTTGSHLHYEVRFYGRTKNPWYYFNKKKSNIFVDKRYLN